MIIINFFEYTLSGWVYIIWIILMIIFSLACLGVVGDKVAKKRAAELKELREKQAQEEYKKAQEVIDKQAHSTGIDNTLDPTAAKTVEQPMPESAVQEVSIPDVVEEAPAINPEPAVVVLDEPVKEPEQVVDNVTPMVDNTSEDAVKSDDVPAVLVIEDTGSNS